MVDKLTKLSPERAKKGNKEIEKGGSKKERKIRGVRKRERNKREKGWG